jgi:hypothetical protein
MKNKNMKIKSIIFIGAVCGLSFMSSCKKDWDCQCTTNGIVTNNTIDNETLLNARDKCKAEGGSIGGVTTTCALQ